MTITAKSIRDTRKASLISIDGREVWVPKSAILKCSREPGRQYEPSCWDYELSDWIVRQKGLTAEARWDNLQNEGQADGYNPHRS